MFACPHSLVVFGLKQNRCQFIGLLLVNALVGALLGLERTRIPAWADWHFGIQQHTVLLSFIAVFGLFKALTNLTTGYWLSRYSRKTILITGWLIAFPIPILLVFEPTWTMMLLVNALLGIQQGITWSTTVVMKMDIVGNKQRGLAMGLNEFTGYFALALSAWLVGRQSVFDYNTLFPILPALLIILLGLLMSVIVIRDTKAHVDLLALEEKKHLRIVNPFQQATFLSPTLRTFTQVGFFNNLNDGLMWGLLPALCWQYHYSQGKLAILAGVYPAVWALGQLITGPMSDRVSKSAMLAWGMLLQAVAIFGLVWFATFPMAVLFAMMLGWGTALVYPTCLSGMAEHTHPANRAQVLGVYRFWRDFGYVVGALMTGVLADVFTVSVAVQVVGFLTLCSGVYVLYTKRRWHLSF